MGVKEIREKLAKNNSGYVFNEEGEKLGIIQNRCLYCGKLISEECNVYNQSTNEWDVETLFYVDSELITLQEKSNRFICDDCSKIIKNGGYMSLKKRVYWLSDINKTYFESYLNSVKNEKTKSNYKSELGMFLESLDEKDAAMASPQEIELYCSDPFLHSTKEKRRSYIRSFLSYIVGGNIEGAQDRSPEKLKNWLFSSGSR